MKKYLILIVALFSAQLFAVPPSGFGDPVERLWLDEMAHVARTVLAENGHSRAHLFPSADRAYLVRNPWETLPVGTNWVLYWGMSICNQYGHHFTVPLGCVGGTAVKHKGTWYSVILHMGPEMVDIYNQDVAQNWANPHPNWFKKRCHYDLVRMVNTHAHEGLHTIGYKHGSSMSNMETAIEQRFHSIYGQSIRAYDSDRCAAAGGDG